MRKQGPEAAIPARAEERKVARRLTRFRQNSITPTPGQYAAYLHPRGRAPSVILETTATNTLSANREPAKLAA